MTIESPAGLAASETAKDQGRRGLVRLRPKNYSWLTPIAFAILFVIFAIWLQGRFFNVDGRMLDIHQNTPVYLLALGEMIILIAGHVDLSVASMATLCSFVVFELSNAGVPMILAIIIAIAIGAVGGLLNSFLVVNLKVNSFIATIATSGIFDGLSLVTSHGTQVLPGTSHPAPHWFTGTGSLGNFTADVPQWLAWLAYALIVVAVARAAQRVARRSTTRTWPSHGAAAVVLIVAVLLATIGPGQNIARRNIRTCISSRHGASTARRARPATRPNVTASSPP